jgi:hypothetical protein
MYIHAIDPDSGGLTYHCRNCGQLDQESVGTVVTVSDLNVNQETDQSYTHLINQYTKYDPTLPRTRLMPCPNTGCPSNGTNGPNHSDGPNTRQNPEVVYVRYDHVKLKYVYICCDCDTVWTP